MEIFHLGMELRPIINVKLHIKKAYALSQHEIKISNQLSVEPS